MFELRHLKTLRALAEHGTINAAAASLHLTPSAASQQLTALSKATRCVLLERRGRRVTLTKAGWVLVHYANSIFEICENAHADLRAYQTVRVGTLRLSAMPTTIAGFVASAAARLMSDDPGMVIEIDDMDSEDALVRLLDHEIDAAVVMTAPNRPLLSDKRVTLEPLVIDPYSAVVPGQSMLAGRKTVCLSELANEPWILSKRSTSCYEVVAAACVSAGFHVKSVQYATDFHASIAMVASGLGVTLVPLLGLPPQVPPTAKVLPIEPGGVVRHIVLATRTGDAYPDLVDALRGEAKIAIDRNAA